MGRQYGALASEELHAMYKRVYEDKLFNELPISRIESLAEKFFAN